MDAIRCRGCGSLWLSYIARDVIKVSQRCLRCDSTELDVVPLEAPRRERRTSSAARAASAATRA